MSVPGKINTPPLQKGCNEISPAPGSWVVLPGYAIMGLFCLCCFGCLRNSSSQISLSHVAKSMHHLYSNALATLLRKPVSTYEGDWDKLPNICIMSHFVHLITNNICSEHPVMSVLWVTTTATIWVHSKRTMNILLTPKHLQFSNIFSFKFEKIWPNC